MSRYLPLICLALMHTLVDTCALLIEPLWPELKKSFALVGVATLSIAFVVQSMPTSLSQVVFGYLRDRRQTPWLLWFGPLLAAVFLTTIGISASKLLLCLCLLVGGIGVGAFHPEAAVAAGRTMPGQRTRALSLFMFGGSLGLGLGPTLSGWAVSRWGLGGLVYLTLPLVLTVGLLWRVGRLRQISHTEEPARERLSLLQSLDGRGGMALFVLLVCSLRLVPNMAMAKVLAFALAAEGYEADSIGLMQTLFLVSASAGMFLMAFRFRSGWERGFMIWCPVASIPLLFILGYPGCPRWLFIATLIPSGIVLWGTAPAMVSYAQQQFPRGAGVASAITMGLAWGFGGLIQAPVTAYFQNAGTPQRAFHAFIPCLLLAAVGAWMLPVTRSESVSA